MDEDQYMSECIARDQGASEEEIKRNRERIHRMASRCPHCGEEKKPKKFVSYSKK
jgi:hypothetical protein